MAAAIVFAIISLSTLRLTDAQNVGFSVELIHRDSIKSPFYNPFETTFDRVTNAFRHSFSRVHRFYPNSITTTEANPDIIVNTGEYLMNISLGTPSFSVVALADTGSDLIWTQCSPCSQCFKQDAPLFDPTKSSTYRKMSCITYGDNSSFRTDEGNIVIDLGTTLTLLPSDFYSQLESAMESQFNGIRAQGPKGFNLCYVAIHEFEAPEVTVHFANADVKLKTLNTFVNVDDSTACFAFSPAQNIAIYGNLAQMNFLIGYDTKSQTVSFKSTDCSKN
ncbi:hypothetical protein PVK06_029239 [Gossypium arboreum]|uniref:Peptidase A1 domain-containing protein n=1 Tax=Gossypium arboreum TaxID=29729 RepID=A0ABR0P656_GOSAR|nr:hypothetical protein PVK06_029239 [Gossypium arboreum]